MSNDPPESTTPNISSCSSWNTGSISEKCDIFGSNILDVDIVKETSVGNVSRSTIIPSRQGKKLKKGTLIFDACFESGNLSKVEYISEFEFDLYIRTDTCNPKFRVWFNFTVENCFTNQRVIFNVVNFSKTKSLYREGMSPLVRSSSRPKWSRIPRKNVFYYRCPEHQRSYVMSFAFCFDREEVYQFCYCYPYTYAQLQAYLDELDRKAYIHYKRELLGLSLQKRRIDLLTITHPENEPTTSTKKGKIVFVTARVHPGETPSSYVCQGFIDFMVSEHLLAQELRKHLIFKIVPMLNPDGVYLGNYRCSLMGFDLNRQWQNPSQWAHPEIFAVKQLLMQLDQSTTLDVNFFIDIHAHSTLLNGFMYGNVFEDEERAERQAVFPNLLSQFAEDFSLPQTNFNRDEVKAGTGRRTLGGILDNHTLCYTLEVSFFSYTNVLTGEMVPYTEEKYGRLGRNLARTFHEYYAKQGLFKRSAALANVHDLPGAYDLPLSMGDLGNKSVNQMHPLSHVQNPLGKRCDIDSDAKGDCSLTIRRQASHSPEDLNGEAVIARSLSNRLNTENASIHEYKIEVEEINQITREPPNCESKPSTYQTSQNPSS